MSVKSEERRKKYAKTTLKYRKMGSGFNNNDAKRIRKVASEMVEFEGKKPLGKIMIENGYSKAYAKNPQKLTKTKVWNDVMDEFFPMEKLARRINEGLDATVTKQKKVVTEDDNGKLVIGFEDYEEKDMSVRHKYVETGLKARGLINKKQEGNNNAGNGFSLIELAKSAVELDDEIKRRAVKREIIDNNKTIDLKSV